MRKIFLSRDAIEDRVRIFEVLSDCSDEVAEHHIMRLDAALEDLQDSIITWSYFFVTGEPYRAKLFRISRRFQAYIIYTIENDVIRVYRIWDTRQDPDEFRISREL